MLKNKKVNMILSVVIAIFLWGYVVGEVNPNTTVKIKDVSVSVLNKETLKEAGLVVINMDELKVDVTLQGKKSEIDKTSKREISATIDMKSFREGNNIAKIDVIAPEDLEVEKVSPYEINVKVEKIKTQSKEVRAVFSGELQKDKEIGDVVLAPNKIEVRGAESYVNKVDYVKAKVDVSKLGKEKKITTELVPVNKDGKKVENINMSEDKVEVSAVILETKTVPLEVKTVGEVAENKQIEKIDNPSEVTIKGTKNQLKNIDKIRAEDIDVDGLEQTESFPLSFILPKEIEIGNASKNLQVKVILKDLSEKSQKYSKDKIEFRNLSEGMKASITQGVVVNILGKKDIIDGFSEKDIVLYMDLKKLGVGTYDVKINAKYEKKFAKVVITPMELKVTIREE